MKFNTLVIYFALGLFLLSSCATLFYGNSDKISITSNPSGADVEINGKKTGKQTPCEIRVVKDKFVDGKENSYYYTLKKEGYTPLKRNQSASFHPLVYLDFACALLPGVFDGAVGKAYKYKTSFTEVLKPLPNNTLTKESVDKKNNKFTSSKETKSDIDINIPNNPQTNDKTFVVIIANENYQKEAKVKFALNDGNSFKEYCEKTLGIPTQNIHFSPDATYGNIKSELKWITDVAKAFKGEAKLIFYYAGNGIPNEQTKESYLLPIDGVFNDFESAIKLDELYQRFAENPTKLVTVILDACFNGSQRDNGMLAEARGVKIRIKQGTLMGNMVCISAAKNDETAFPYIQQEHGMLTYFLLKKLQETKGETTYKDLFDYILQNVSQNSLSNYQQSQNPQIQSSEKLLNWGILKLK